MSIIFGTVTTAWAVGMTGYVAFMRHSQIKLQAIVEAQHKDQNNRLNVVRDGLLELLQGVPVMIQAIEDVERKQVVQGNTLNVVQAAVDGCINLDDDADQAHVLELVSESGELDQLVIAHLASDNTASVLFNYLRRDLPTIIANIILDTMKAGGVIQTPLPQRVREVILAIATERGLVANPDATT